LTDKAVFPYTCAKISIFLAKKIQRNETGERENNNSDASEPEIRKRNIFLYFFLIASQ